MFSTAVFNICAVNGGVGICPLEYGWDSRHMVLTPRASVIRSHDETAAIYIKQKCRMVQ